MTSIRVFTTYQPEAVRESVSLPAGAEIHATLDFSRPPATVAGYFDKWPPDWIGVVADLERVAMKLRDDPPADRVTLAVSGLHVASSPELQEVIEIVGEVGISADIIIGPGD